MRELQDKAAAARRSAPRRKTQHSFLSYNPVSSRNRLSSQGHYQRRRAHAKTKDPPRPFLSENGEKPPQLPAVCLPGDET